MTSKKNTIEILVARLEIFIKILQKKVANLGRKLPQISFLIFSSGRTFLLVVPPPIKQLKNSFIASRVRHQFVTYLNERYYSYTRVNQYTSLIQYWYLVTTLERCLILFGTELSEGIRYPKFSKKFLNFQKLFKIFCNQKKLFQF